MGVFGSLARTLFGSWKLLILFGSEALYVAFVLYWARRWGLWHSSSRKETIYWFIAAGVVLAGNSTHATNDPRFVRNVASKVLGVSFLAILVEFLVNYYTFRFLIEVILVFVVLALGGMIAVARAPEHAQIRKYLDRVLVAIGALLLFVTVIEAVVGLDQLLTRENAEELLVGPVLTLMLIPFLYGWGLISGYEQLFFHIKFSSNKDRSFPRGARWEIFQACKLSLGRLTRFSKQFTWRLHALETQEDLNGMMRQFSESERRLGAGS